MVLKEEYYLNVKKVSVHGCHSCQINVFNLILNNKVCFSTILKKVEEEDYGRNSQRNSRAIRA